MIRQGIYTIIVFYSSIKIITLSFYYIYGNNISPYNMPFLTEDDLLDLHKDIDTQKEKIENLEDEQEDLNEQNATLKKSRLFLAIIASIFGLLLLTGLVFYFTLPEVFINRINLEKEKQHVMPAENYNKTKEAIVFKENDDPETSTVNIEELEEKSIEGITIYAVQIKAFEEKSISLYSNNLIQFREIYEDEFYKYTIGAFETLDEAQLFRKEILELGFKDAFVASYIDGERLRIEEPENF